MANIMLTNTCNLRCSYCFANEFVNKNINNISIENFRKAVDFATRHNSNEHIGIIGGEPTLHPNFEMFLQELIENDEVKDVMVFSNGVNIDKFTDVLSNNKIKLLINCNEPEIIGMENYKKIVSNLHEFIKVNPSRENIALGLNIYSPNMNYSYIFDLIKELKLDKIRLSITVPNFELSLDYNPINYYEKMKDITMSIIKEALSNHIMPFYDCNKIPTCLISNEERREMLRLNGSNIISNVISKESNCYPVIDILQDLTAVRCFGLSEQTKVRIEDFEDIMDLRSYYMESVDKYSHDIWYTNKCKSCSRRIEKKCNGGCLSYKIDKIINNMKVGDNIG